MKVLHLTSYDTRGGAARAAYRQHAALLAAGVDSQILVRYKDSDDDRVTRYTPTASGTARALRWIRRLGLSLDSRIRKTRDGATGTAWADDRSDFSEKVLDGFTPDVVNLHFTANFIDFPSFFRHYASSAPLAITMHDMWTFTGGCHYSCTCTQYQENCGGCPVLRSKRKSDDSRASWKRKSTAFARVPSGRLAFVANSHWVADKARRSRLLHGRRVESIHCGIDTQIYRPGSRVAAREALGIPPTEKLILFGAANVADPRKGFAQLRSAIEGSPLLRNGFYLSVGNGHVRFPSPARHLHLGHIESDVLLASVYRAADLFVMPSLEEAFGQTALESVACGTPVVAFATGGIPEIVLDGVNGRLCPVGDVNALREAIEELTHDDSIRSRWAREASAFVESRFSYPLIARRYLALYEELVLSRSSA
jgi:glycosyltransferase involved in cell wall biosynthesis